MNDTGARFRGRGLGSLYTSTMIPGVDIGSKIANFGKFVGSSMATRVNNIVYTSGDFYSSAYEALSHANFSDLKKVYRKSENTLFYINIVIIVIFGILFATFLGFSIHQYFRFSGVLIRGYLYKHFTILGTVENTFLATYVLWPIILVQIFIVIAFQIFPIGYRWYDKERMEDGGNYRCFGCCGDDEDDVPLNSHPNTSNNTNLSSDSLTYIWPLPNAGINYNIISDKSLLKSIPDDEGKPYGKEYYMEVLLLSINKYSWIRMICTGMLINWSIAVIVGVNDVMIFIAVAFISLVMYMTCGLHEWIHTSFSFFARTPTPNPNQKTMENNTAINNNKDTIKLPGYASESINWWILGFSVIPFIALWIILLSHLISLFCCGSIATWLPVTIVIVSMSLHIGLGIYMAYHITQVKKLLSQPIPKSNGINGGSIDIQRKVIKAHMKYEIAKIIFFGLIEISPAILILIGMYI